MISGSASDWCLMPSKQLSNSKGYNIMVRTSCISLRWWWCLLCTKQYYLWLNSSNFTLSRGMGCFTLNCWHQIIWK